MQELSSSLHPRLPVLPPSVFAVQREFGRLKQDLFGGWWYLLAWTVFGHGLFGLEETAPFSSYVNVSCRGGFSSLCAWKTQPHRKQTGPTSRW